MMEQALFVVQAQQQRAHSPALRRVAESSDNTIGGTDSFDLAHGALTGDVGFVQTLGHDAVEAAASQLAHPTLGLAPLGRGRRQAHAARAWQLAEKVFQVLTPL